MTTPPVPDPYPHHGFLLPLTPESAERERRAKLWSGSRVWKQHRIAGVKQAVALIHARMGTQPKGHPSTPQRSNKKQTPPKRTREKKNFKSPLRSPAATQPTPTRSGRERRTTEGPPTFVKDKKGRGNSKRATNAVDESQSRVPPSENEVIPDSTTDSDEFFNKTVGTPAATVADRPSTTSDGVKRKAEEPPAASSKLDGNKKLRRESKGGKEAGENQVSAARPEVDSDTPSSDCIPDSTGEYNPDMVFSDSDKDRLLAPIDRYAEEERDAFLQRKLQGIIKELLDMGECQVLWDLKDMHAERKGLLRELLAAYMYIERMQEKMEEKGVWYPRFPKGGSPRARIDALKAKSIRWGYDD